MKSDDQSDDVVGFEHGNSDKAFETPGSSGLLPLSEIQGTPADLLRPR